VVEPSPAAPEFDLSPETVVVRYDKPYELPPLSWRWWPARWRRRGYRRVREGFAFRPLPLRDYLQHQATFTELRRGLGPFDLAAVCAVITGAPDEVLYMPKRVLRALIDTYRWVNEIEDEEEPRLDPEAEGSVTPVTVAFDAVVRRLQRAPFNLTRAEILELTIPQIKKRLEDWGDEQLDALKAEAAMRGVDVG